MGLKQYKAKREFSRTLEPAGRVHRTAQHRDLMFVVQKHDATRLHYDFRLEMEGVLKSWAVPKGFPTKRGDRRLAIEVEDHPIEYADFEGTIPEGNYGAGTVIVWDTGTYEASGDDPVETLHRGKLHLTLKGRKLKGEWTLIRLRRENGNKPQWLLMKTGDDAAPFSARAENESVLTRRTLEQVAAGKGKVKQWQSDRPAKRSRAPLRRKQRVNASARMVRAASDFDLSRLPAAKAAFVEPMKAVLVEQIPQGPHWIYELKLDGIRALAIERDNTVRLMSRTAKDMTAKYPQVAEALQKLTAHEAVLDGEIVAVDQQGRPGFQLLQCYHMPGAQKPPLFYYVFDLINLDGRDLRGLPLLQRKKMAEALIKGLPDIVRYSGGLQADPARVIKQMKQRGLEGLIAKKTDSQYESGRRSGAWVKFKWANEQEFVIGGYTLPKGSRNCFGAILVGYYEGEKLLFAAKVGTGFGHKLLQSLYKSFQGLVRSGCPFANLPEKSVANGKGLTAGEMRRCTWLEPKLVCQVRFAEWTRDRHLRQPAFLGLREDKEPEEVVREKVRR